VILLRTLASTLIVAGFLYPSALLAAQTENIGKTCSGVTFAAFRENWNREVAKLNDSKWLIRDVVIEPHKREYSQSIAGSEIILVLTFDTAPCVTSASLLTSKDAEVGAAILVATMRLVAVACPELTVLDRKDLVVKQLRFGERGIISESNADCSNAKIQYHETLESTVLSVTFRSRTQD
jgi:hypothetical protein